MFNNNCSMRFHEKIIIKKIQKEKKEKIKKLEPKLFAELKVQLFCYFSNNNKYLKYLHLRGNNDIVNFIISFAVNIK